MFVQGGLCFFCKQPLPKAEASVEHLLAGANGGSNKDENCVACCKAVNALLGSMSLKEKFQVVLNQKGQFKCPNGVGAAIPNGSSTKREISGSDSSLTDQFEVLPKIRTSGLNRKHTGNDRTETEQTDPPKIHRRV